MRPALAVAVGTPWPSSSPTLSAPGKNRFRGCIPTAHTLAYLRIADPVTEAVARLATDLLARL